MSKSKSTTKKNIKNNSAKSAATCKIIITLVMSAVFFIISVLIILNFKMRRNSVSNKNEISDKIYNLAKEANNSNFHLTEKNSLKSDQKIDEETGLPFVDQEKLGGDYIKDLKIIINNIEQMQISSLDTAINVDAIKIIKKEAMNKIVPKQYQYLHIDLIFALDSIIDGDIDGAIKRLSKIKNNI